MVPKEILDFFIMPEVSELLPKDSINSRTADDDPTLIDGVNDRWAASTTRRDITVPMGTSVASEISRWSRPSYVPQYEGFPERRWQRGDSDAELCDSIRYFRFEEV